MLFWVLGFVRCYWFGLFSSLDHICQRTGNCFVLHHGSHLGGKGTNLRQESGHYYQGERDSDLRSHRVLRHIHTHVFFLRSIDSHSIAPLRCYFLSICSLSMARVPVVYGCLLVGRGEYVVSHSPTGRLQTQRLDPNVCVRHCLLVLLRVMDYHSNYHLPRNPCGISTDGLRWHSGNKKHLPLAITVHSHSFLFVYPESEVVV